MFGVPSKHEVGKPAPGESVHSALALVNSRRNGPNGQIDELASTAQLCRWLTGHHVVAVQACDSAALHSVIALRDAVRELLRARIEGRTPDPNSLQAVNQAAAAAPTARLLDWPSVDGPSERRDCLGAGGITLARALLAENAIELVVGPTHADLRACGAPGCVRLLLKDHPRRQWCSTRCGDRVRANRYYHRHHPETGETAR